VKKVMEKSPLKFSLARSMSSLDPQEMATAAKETKQNNPNKANYVENW